MPNSIDTMISEWQRKTQLDEKLGSERQSAESSCNRGGFEVPAKHGCDEVGSGEGVHSAGGDGARDSVQSTGVPGDLGTVDAQVRRDGALETLLGEYFGGICCCGCCRGWSFFKGCMLAEM